MFVQDLCQQLKEKGVQMVLPAMADSRLLVMLQQVLEAAKVPCAAPSADVLANAQHKARSALSCLARWSCHLHPGRSCATKLQLQACRRT